MLQNNSHFTPELLICALGDLTMSNLAHTARLRDCQRPTLKAGLHEAGREARQANK